MFTSKCWNPYKQSFAAGDGFPPELKLVCETKHYGEGRHRRKHQQFLSEDNENEEQSKEAEKTGRHAQEKKQVDTIQSVEEQMAQNSSLPKGERTAN